jgi:NADPH:quinone reductase-like Zn-dependent oxidoreductase
MDDESQNTINHRVVVTRRGGPEMLLVIEEDLPEPAPDEVRIQVEAAAPALSPSAGFARRRVRRAMRPSAVTITTL